MNIAVKTNTNDGFQKFEKLSAGLYEVEGYKDWLLIVPTSIQSDCFWIDTINNKIIGQSSKACMSCRYKKSNRKITLSND